MYVCIGEGRWKIHSNQGMNSIDWKNTERVSNTCPYRTSAASRIASIHLSIETFFLKTKKKEMYSRHGAEEEGRASNPL